MKKFILGVFYRGVVLPIFIILFLISLCLYPLYWVITKRDSMEDFWYLIPNNSKMDKYL